MFTRTIGKELGPEHNSVSIHHSGNSAPAPGQYIICWSSGYGLSCPRVAGQPRYVRPVVSAMDSYRDGCSFNVGGLRGTDTSLSTQRSVMSWSFKNCWHLNTGSSQENRVSALDIRGVHTHLLSLSSAALSAPFSPFSPPPPPLPKDKKTKRSPFSYLHRTSLVKQQISVSGATSMPNYLPRRFGCRHGHEAKYARRSIWPHVAKTISSFRLRCQA